MENHVQHQGLISCPPLSLYVVDFSAYLRQEQGWIDIFKLTAFDPMLAYSDLPNRFFSNPSGASTQLFLGLVVSPLHLTDMYKSHCY
jgi:hypothetical protein